MTTIGLIFSIIGLPVVLYVVGEVVKLANQNKMSLEEELELIENYGNMGYVSTEKMIVRSKLPPVKEDTPEEIADYKAFEKERDEKRAAYKKRLGFVEAECPVCDHEFLVRRVRDDHIKEE